MSTRTITHQAGFPIGERGQSIGHCCGNGCIDCAFWCRDASRLDPEYKAIMANLKSADSIAREELLSICDGFDYKPNKNKNNGS